MNSFKKYAISSDVVVQICKHTTKTLMDFEPIIIDNDIVWLKIQDRSAE